jgi:hypothetical protein
LCAKIACHKINSLKFPKGIEGDALKAHFLLRERMLAKCPLYGYLEGDGMLRMAILDEGFGGNLEWIKRAHLGLEINLNYLNNLIEKNAHLKQFIYARGNHQIVQFLRRIANL